ncbi:microtubule organization protein AKNA isoform X1 [Hippoglossus stenolepis]|uniref:microtubule organization protein AKNA isoform X1 n=1 Tax=Hippoglossus stenolepis TaxID=195615 RepID=UPI001FAF1CB5|nr:microtubule organization protein AKNA isoform X1 [Hippoglossus stenolepis]XP_047200318.1 microtubule organization protein AKNA isoform X1 [Hippoglossus stenolepis]
MDYHFTAEEMAAASGIEDETFPEMGFTESPPESHSSRISLRSSPRPQKSEMQEVKWPHTASVFPEVTRVYDGPLNGSVESDQHHKQPGRSQRTTNQMCPEASHSGIWTLSGAESLKSRPSPDRELRTPEVNESRIVPLTYPTPDFSKVKPKVRLPIGDYKPPVSRGSSMRESLSSHIMYMSPADIVREVLLNTTDRSPDPSAPNSNGPQDFRSRQEAITLVEQLQEDHNRLLTKHAEANNTIDRLRLKAKVDLYSEPPQPGHSVQSGLSHDSSKVMTLDFPRAQRAEINSGSLHPDGHRAPPSPYVGEQLAEILHTQTDEFLQQLQIYEDLLKRKQLKPSEQMKGLSQLNEGLDSLERGFLFARDEHKLLNQRGEDVGHFDQQRELGGLIFQCGMRMDELKEQAEQMRQDQPTCEAPPSPPPHPTPPSAPSEDGRWSLPQSPLVPLLVDPGRAAELEVSPATEESDDEETGDEETLRCQYLKLLTGKHRRAEQDFAALADHYGSFQELPSTFEYNLREAAFFSGTLGSHERPGVDETERQRIGNMDERRKSEPHYEESPVGIRTQRSSRSSPSSHADLSPPASLPVPPPSGHRESERERFHSSSLSSLGETPASERRNSKLQPGSSRTLSQQDGVISPETDSGFIGSESCHLTPAAGPSPLHQGASQSDLVHQDGNTRKPQAVSASSPPSSPIHRLTGAESRGASWALSPEQTSRGRQRRRSSSCSPQRWVSQAERTRADRGARLESDSSESRTVSEDGHSDQFAGSLSFQLSSSPTTPRHHGNSLRALGPRVVADRNALRTLEAQVIRLEEIMHRLWNKKTPSPVRAAPSTQENHTHLYTSTPRSRPEERCQSNVRKGRRQRQMAEEVEECILRPTARERSPCVDRRPPQRDIFAGSDPETFTSQPQPRISRRTQTSSAAPGSCCSHTNTVQSNKTHPRQLPAESIQASNTADEPDLRNHPPPVLCVKCSSRLRGRSARPAGGSSESTPSSSSCSRHCPLCGCLQPKRDTKTDCHRDSAPRTSGQSAESPDRAARRGYHAAPAPQQCMLVGPPLLVYSQPVHVSPSNNPGTSSGVRGHKESRGRMRRSRSVDGQNSLDVSLDRAIRVAQHMKQTSRHMACSLATGLQFQERLTQSCRR